MFYLNKKPADPQIKKRMATLILPTHSRPKGFHDRTNLVVYDNTVYTSRSFEIEIL